MYFKIIALISCIACVHATGEPSTNINNTLVSIYYETYCPDSIKFITTQFFPAYSKLNGTYITPHLVPFGNANFTTSVNGTITFSCQHGEKECNGNKVHACLLTAVPSSPLSDKLKFINCTMSLTDTKSATQVYPTEQCAAKSGINVNELNTCVSNESAANNALAAFGNQTKKYKIDSVPFVIFENKYDQDVSKKAVSDFSGVLCNDYIKTNDTKVREVLCGKPPGNSASAATLTVLPVIVFTYLFSKMY